MSDTRPKVLIVDDDTPIREMYARAFLESGEFEVRSEESGEGALAWIIQEKDVGLVVTDIMMARMDGWALLDHIRNELKLAETVLPVIVVSGVHSDDLEFAAFKHRANAWFTKPIRPLSRLVEMGRMLTGLKR